MLLKRTFCLLLCLALAALGLSQGTVVAWGDDYYGTTDVPQGLTDAIAVAAGDSHSLALRSDGTVVGWGSNSRNQAAPPFGLNGVTAIAAGWEHSLALKSDGTVVAWGAHNFLNPDEIDPPGVVPPGLTGVIAIAAGYDHSLALKSDGTVVAWGWNDYGELNVPAGLTGVISVAAGNYHSLALKSDGTVVAWGNNQDGQATVPPALTGVIAIAAGGNHSLALKSNGTVVAWGDNADGEGNVPIGLSNVTGIAAGGYHNLALRADGTVVAWGFNGSGESTVPGGITGVFAISAGSFHNLEIFSVVDQPPTANAGPDQTLELTGVNTSGTLDGSGSADSDGDALTYKWSESGSQIATGSTPTVSLGIGAHTIKLVVDDGKGGTAEDTVQITVADTTPPSIDPYAAIIAEAASASGKTVTFTLPTAHDAGGQPTVTCSPVSGSLFPLGTNLVTITAEDASGNIAQATFNVAVVDTTDPSIGSQANLVLEATSASGRVVTFPGLTATDSVDGSVPVVCTPASGSTFPLGTTLVTAAATDAAGNRAEITFTVKIVDATPPVFGAIADVTAGATSSAGAVVTFASPIAADVVDGNVTGVCTPASGSLFPVGTTVVTVKATDAAGNVGATTFSVTVGDRTPPVFGFIPNVTATATSALGTMVTFPSPIAVDAIDGNVTGVCTPASGSQFHAGVNPVVVTATDSAGNVGYGTFNVIVTYDWSGFLSPFPKEGYKAGSTVSIKFQLTGASSNITNLVATASRALVTGGTLGSYTLIGTFKYSALNNQYILNWATPKLPKGTYRVKVELGDGVLRTVDLVLK